MNLDVHLSQWLSHLNLLSALPLVRVPLVEECSIQIRTNRDSDSRSVTPKSFRL